VTCALTVTDPLVLGPAQLLGTNVPENDYAEWDSIKVYPIGERVMRDHAVWESAQGNNKGNDPTTAGEWLWMRVGPTNRWAAFEASHTTSTSKAGGFWYEFKPGYAISAIHITDMIDCMALRVTLTDPVAGVVWDTGLIAVGRVIPSASWWQWCFGRRVQVTQKHWYDLPTYPQSNLRIEVIGGNSCSVGCFMAGQTTSFGDGIKTGLRLGIDDYSRKTRDQWGAEQLRVGAYSQRISLALLLHNSELDALYNFLAQRRTRVLFWSISKRWNSTGVIGFYRNWDILVSYSMYSDVSIDLEGMQTL